MKIIKIVLLIFLFYFLALFQSSFLLHFNIFAWTPNIILIVLILWGIIESPKKYCALWASLIGGFFLDIFSVRFFGFNILLFLAMSLFLKFIFKNYVRIPFFEKT